MGEYFKNNELGRGVFNQKWLQKEEITIQDAFERIAEAIVAKDKELGYEDGVAKETILRLFNEKKFILGGSYMSSVGTEKLVSTRNCFVIGNTADSYNGIYRTALDSVNIMKRRGGVGHDLSHIRPKGSAVNNAANTSTGIVPFMEQYSDDTRRVAQDGRR